MYKLISELSRCPNAFVLKFELQFSRNVSSSGCWRFWLISCSVHTRKWFENVTLMLDAKIHKLVARMISKLIFLYIKLYSSKLSFVPILVVSVKVFSKLSKLFHLMYLFYHTTERWVLPCICHIIKPFMIS